jgi:hypothetical protein
MAGITTHFALPYPEESDNISEGATKITELAKKLDTLLWERLLNLSEHNASFSATTGQLVKCTAAITVTSPAAASNAVFGVLANGHAVTIKTASGKIYGDFIEGAEEVKLVGYQYLILQSDGTNWFIIAGAPKREQLPVGQDLTKAECEAGITPSATRPALVIFYVTAEGESRVEVEGVLVAPTSLTSHVPVTFEVLPGQKWKSKLAGHAVTLLK